MTIHSITEAMIVLKKVTLRTVVEFPLLSGPNSVTWQLSGICDSCSILESNGPHLQLFIAMIFVFLPIECFKNDPGSLYYL